MPKFATVSECKIRFDAFTQSVRMLINFSSQVSQKTTLLYRFWFMPFS